LLKNVCTFALSILKFENMETVRLEVDVSKPAGRRVVEELENKNFVYINLQPNVTDLTYTHNEVWEKFEKKFNAHYGTDLKFDYRI